MEPIRGTELHPLQNPDILEKVFEGSTLKDLKVYRQVCRAWMLGSSKAMKDTAKVRISNFSNCFRDYGPDAFMKLVENELSTFTKTSFPAKFVLSFGNAGIGVEFWMSCGSYIKSLHLMDINFRDVEQFRQFIFVCCPNLEELKIQDCNLAYKKKRVPVAYGSEGLQFQIEEKNHNLKFLFIHNLFKREFKFLWVKFLNNFPSLEALHVISDVGWENCDPLFKALKIVFQPLEARECKLKELRFDFSILENPDEAMENLLAGNFAVENLMIFGFNSRRCGSALRKVLSGFADSLKKLSLEAYSNLSRLGREDQLFPLLANLEELQLIRNPLNSTHFWRSVPNLKKLVLVEMTLSSMRQMIGGVDVQEVENFALTSCNELEFTFGRKNILSEKYFRELSVLLPNVEILKVVNSTTEGISKMCESWPKLKSLEVESYRCLDGDITGLDEDDVKKINEGGEMGAWKPITVPRASIASLKDLETLSIKSREGLGYCSAAYGIQGLTNLQQLRLDFEEVDEETWIAVWKPLLDRFPWKRN